MPNQFQPFNLSTDVITTKTLLHEALPITGTIYKFQTGSYIEENIKNFNPILRNDEYYHWAQISITP